MEQALNSAYKKVKIGEDLQYQEFPSLLKKIQMKTKRTKSILENVVNGKHKTNTALKMGKNTIDIFADFPNYFVVNLKEKKAPGKVIFSKWTDSIPFKVYMSYTEKKPTEERYFDYFFVSENVKKGVKTPHFQIQTSIVSRKEVYDYEQMYFQIIAEKDTVLTVHVNFQGEFKKLKPKPEEPKMILHDDMDKIEKLEDLVKRLRREDRNQRTCKELIKNVTQKRIN